MVLLATAYNIGSPKPCWASISTVLLKIYN